MVGLAGDVLLSTADRVAVWKFGEELEKPALLDAVADEPEPEPEPKAD